MSRLLALRALQGLSLDVQQLIFAATFPTRHQIDTRLQVQHPTLPEFQDLDAELIDFVHDGENQWEFPFLSKTERRWLHNRCDLFALFHESVDSDVGRVVVIGKEVCWSYDDDAEVEPFRWGKATWPGGVLCDNCGRTEPPFIVGQLFCFGCMEELQIS